MTSIREKNVNKVKILLNKIKSKELINLLDFDRYIEENNINKNYRFLLKKYGAIYEIGRKVYVKENFMINEENINNILDKLNKVISKEYKEEINETICINYLKKLGYKILKPKYVEI